jgi:hypothetical protein
MWWVALLAAGISGIAAAWRARGADRRQRALMVASWRAGVRFSVLNPFPDAMWLPFPLFAPARNPRITNVVWERRDPAIRAFDLRVELVPAADTSGLTIATHADLSCASVALPSSCPRLTVLARGTTDPSGLPLEGQEVTLELEAFNRRFRVTADDPRAAVAILDQRMMRALLALPVHAAVHVNAATMLLVAPRLEAPQMLVLLSAARGLARAVPRVVSSLYPPRPEEGPHEDRWMQGRWSPEPTSSDPPD